MHVYLVLSGQRYDGQVVAVLPAAKNEGTPLWHVKYEVDDDSEDLDEGRCMYVCMRCHIDANEACVGVGGLMLYSCRCVQLKS